MVEAQTVADGSVTVVTSQTAKPLNSLTFCVTSITHGTLQDFSGNECSSL
jgi:hypothetical protein